MVVAQVPAKKKGTLRGKRPGGNVNRTETYSVSSLNEMRSEIVQGMVPESRLSDKRLFHHTKGWVKVIEDNTRRSLYTHRVVKSESVHSIISGRGPPK